MSDTSSERQHLLELRATITQRRRWLEKQLANYGIAEAPTKILMQLDSTKAEIEEIDIKLLQLGEDISPINSRDFLDRIRYLEKELAKIRHYLSMQSKPKMFSWGHEWYSISEDSFTIYSKRGEKKEYNFNHNDERGEFEKSFFPPRYITSMDGMFLAILIESGLSSFMLRVYPSEYTKKLETSQLFIFRYGKLDPILETDINTMYVHDLPAFSTENTMLAFSFSHNWRTKQWTPEGAEEPMGLVEWDETVRIMTIDTNKTNDIVTIPVDGYGRWAHPLHFANLIFTQFDEVLFGVSTSEAGIVQSWYIPIDGSQPKITHNPFLAGPSNE